MNALHQGDSMMISLSHPQLRAETLQVSDKRIHLGLALDRPRRPWRFLHPNTDAREPEAFIRAETSGPPIGRSRKAYGGMFRFRNHITRIDQVQTMPVIAVATADAGKVRAGAFAAPLERSVVDNHFAHLAE